MTLPHTKQTPVLDVQEWSVCTPRQRAETKLSAASILARAIFPTSPFFEEVSLFLHFPSGDDLY